MARPKFLVFSAEDTFSPVIWDDGEVANGEVDYFWLDKEYISLSSVIGLKEWYSKADQYDPCDNLGQFTTEGMEEWINQGYEFALRIRKMIPKDIKLYYGYRHQFGDNHWRFCSAYISES